MAWKPIRHTAVLLMAINCILAMQQTTTVLADSTEPPSFIVKYTDDNMYDQVVAQLEGQGFTVLRKYLRFRRLVVTSTPQLSATSTSNAAEPSTSLSASSITPSALQAQETKLMTLSGVTYVERNLMVTLPPPIPSSLQATGAGDGSSTGSLQMLQDMYTNGDKRQTEALATCPLIPADDPDIDTGRLSEGAPYGIEMVQADSEEAQQLAQRFWDKVLFCVIDTGLDIRNNEFSKETTSGCVPGFPNNDTNADPRTCYTWYKPYDFHGTHTSGTIAALKNGKGIVGVSSAKPLLYHYKIFNSDSFSSDTQVDAWHDCIAELDRQKLARRTPDMKLVISMSYGAKVSNPGSPPPDNVEQSFLQEVLKQITDQRNDVLFFAAAGNDGPNTMSTPAIYDEVISVAAVDALQQLASFSSTNKYVDLAAPGVNTLSTIPLRDASSSSYYSAGYRDLLTTEPVISAVTANPDLFYRPVRGVPTGAGTDDVTAPLVYCGLANATCANATGKICLIERGNFSFCQKVANCAAGGGVGAIIYNSAANPECTPLHDITLVIDDGSCSCADPATDFCINTVSLARVQGLALKDALTSEPPFTVSLKFPTIPPQTDIALESVSGTSMATPTAAGVAGLVWSAHTGCTAVEIRSALFNTTLMPSAASQTPSFGTPGSERNNGYGYGIVQAVAAHRYLQRNPCKGNRTVVGVVALVGAAKQPVGAVISTSIKLSDSKTCQPIIGQSIAVTPRPSKRFFTCNDKYIVTDKNGEAGTTCKLLKAGDVSQVFTVARSPGYQKARFIKDFIIKK